MGYGAAGVDVFTGLLDTPGSYAGQSGKLPFIKLTEEGLEFLDPDAFATTKVFDGSTASPPTIYSSPLTAIPYAFANGIRGVYENFTLVVGDWLYSFGGMYLTTAYTNKCYRFHLTAHYWEKLTSMPVNGHSPYKCQCAGHHAGKIYCAVLFADANFDAHVRSYDIANNSWADEGVFSKLSAVSEMWIACASDNLYLHQSHATWGQRFDSMDYGTKAWTARTSLTARGKIASLIGDEIYAVDYSGATFKYNKPATDTWTDQAQACPMPTGCGCNDETEAALWTSHPTAVPYTAYRYTTAGGWVTQYAESRQTRAPDTHLVATLTGKVYLVFGYSGSGQGTDSEWVAGGCIHYYEPSGVWKLLTQSFNISDLLSLYEDAGIPVVVEKDGKPLFIGSGMDTVYIVATGSYLFSLSQDFDKQSVQIWRAVWG